MKNHELSHGQLPLLDPLFPDCPVRNILERVGDKWSQKGLTSTLRTRETDGFLRRKVYAEVPPHTEYSLTPRGISFMEACRPMVQWALDHFAAILKDRQAVFRNQP